MRVLQSPLEAELHAAPMQPIRAALAPAAAQRHPATRGLIIQQLQIRSVHPTFVGVGQNGLPAEPFYLKGNRRHESSRLKPS